MSTATWGELDASAYKLYPTNLLKYLLYQMMTQFSANGACIALYNESKKQMEVQHHVRLRNAASLPLHSGVASEEERISRRRSTIDLNPVEHSPSPSPRGKRLMQVLLELEDVTFQHSELFPVGACYPIGQDLIGYCWRHNEAYIMRHDGYLASFHTGSQSSPRTDITPLWYLAAPIQEVTLSDEARGKRRQPRIFGVVILYQTAPNGGGFHLKQRSEALNFTERIALHLQNEQQQWQHQRSSEYLQKLQKISTAFPTNVKLSELVENIYRFSSEVVDVNSMLITLYDRDTRKMYEVFAVNNRQLIPDLPEKPTIVAPENRPVWSRLALEEQTKLLLEPTNPEQNGYGMYDELLTGIWGDQRRTESFLFLPMRMFTRVIGAISITSMQPHAYQPEEIQVLETMVQIVTVSIENAKLYERSHFALRSARERTELLAALNSALQSIGSVLNVRELLENIVKAVTTLFQEEMCVFFQLSPDQKELAARAAYAPSKIWNDGNELPPDPATLPRNDQLHVELIEQIRIPYQGTILEERASEEGFFYVDAAMADELASKCSEGGAIFLRETGIEKMLMVPVLYQTEMVGILALHTPKQSRVFTPQEVGVLLAITAQAASAIRNAQLFETIQENNAELERMNSLKDEFLVTASHELRTPLSAISGYSTLLKRQSNRIDAEHIMRFATKIAGAAQQLTDLLANMTEAANMGTMDKELILLNEPVQLASIVSSVAGILKINIEQKVIVQIDPDLWVRGAPLPIRQVITNLLDNAAKYSPPDGRIEVLAEASTLAQVKMPAALVDHVALIEHGNDPVVVVHVYDEGEGINPEEQQKIFEKFVRATRSLTTPVRGSGLGLYICRRYIEAMGGKLWLEQSIPGEGSVFSFYLPRETTPPTQSDEAFNPVKE
ncbi:MAG TPA: ATP-binding protein [Ktedonobacteraceae bacterium]|nr:ATP-binding protein [Ktedonobacteraceae bacterium]